MRAVVLTGTGGPEVLQVQERPDPSVGPGEIRIGVRAAGINFADTLARIGLYPDAPKPPCVLGYEVAGEVESVTAVNHKRVWHDVTNADHSRMTLHFEGGREATFVYSDLAAALKPRWYVLGTQGAITAEWRRESVVSRNAVGTMHEDVLAPADAPPRVRLHSPEGDVTELAFRETESHPFHSDLSLWLQYGFLPRVRGEQSRRVISMLEAAEESARMGGIPVKPA